MIYESFWNFGISISLLFSVILEMKNKIETSFKLLVSKKARTWRLKRTSDEYLAVITWNKKHLLKQVVPITSCTSLPRHPPYTLEKKFFAVATFEVL